MPEKAKGKKEGGESTWRKAFICLQIRPDDKTMRWMYQHGFVMNQVGPDGRRPIGHLPGIYIGQQFESRTQIKMAGIHRCVI